MADGDLEEDEVWSVKLSSSEDSTKKLMMKRRRSLNNNNRVPVDQKTSSSTIVDNMVKHSSASMSRICRKPSKRVDIINGNFTHHQEDYDYDYDEEGEEEEMVLPPHEFLARKLERSQISSFSMCEGVGRTLKGRDLSKLRNSILIQTGFLEK
ncbi:uncharacterized protein LOC124912632 [Impatiens glandulifera]|uniref:uncharacterized protein LOC124912632 n=1 Tax=Impatiens glandulifera TaxID=253017 RepID=UPI001FB0CB77|nr:uncharacterized protein LOC124912632 [Impatiens glandulifera]